jgi:hypothetical protein
VSGKTVTIPIEALGSKVDPVTGAGVLFHEGGIKFKKGKKTASVTALELNTATSALTGKLAGKTMKVASVTGLSSTRVGFGSEVKLAAIKLTGNAAKQLNKKLGFSTKKKKSKKSSASASKKKKKKKKVVAPFKGNQVLGSSSTSAEPKTVGVKAEGKAKLDGDLSTLIKFVELGVSVDPIAPTEKEGVATFLFPLSGGTIAPNGLGGVPETKGGIIFNQEPAPGIVLTMTLSDIWVDMGSKKATAEVSITDNSEFVNTPGALGRVSIADLKTESPASIASDPGNRTVTVTNALAVLQGTTAFTLNETFAGGAEKFKEGDPLGTFTFTAQTE